MFSQFVRPKVDLVCFLAKIAMAFSILYPSFSQADDIRIRQKRGATRGIEDDHISEDKLKSTGIENFVFLEFRPTFNYTVGEAHTENSAEYGLLFNRTIKLSYVQTYSTNLYSPRIKKSLFKVPRVRLYDGFLRLKLSELWVSDDKESKFSFQIRTYFPTNSATESSYSRYEQGMLTTVRTYFTFDQKVSENVEWQVSVAPAAYFSHKAGYTFRDKKFAREIFDTQFSAEFDFKICSNLEFEFPIVFQMTKFGRFDTAAELNDRWRATLAIQPELDWEYVKDQTAGIAFNSDSFITADYKSLQLPRAFNQGNVQLIWNIKF